MLKRIAVLLIDGVAAFELGVVCEVFGVDRVEDGFPAYEFATCSPGGRPIRCRPGFLITPSHDLAPLAEADLIAVPAISSTTLDRPAGEPLGVPPEVLSVLRDGVARGARVISV